MSRILIGILAGIALGLGIGFALFSDGSAPASPAALSVSPSDGVVRAAAPADSRLQRPGAVTSNDPPARSAPDERPTVPIPEARLEAAAERVAAKPVQARTGDGVFTGQILDPDGTGVAGVLVRAEANDPSQWLSRSHDVGRPAPDISLDRAVRQAADQYAKRRGSVFETVSDAGGAYRIEGLPDSTFAVRAYKEDYLLRPSDQPESDGRYGVRTGATIDFLARPVVSVPVAVLLPDGTPAEKAAIQCDEKLDRHRRGARYAWSPSEPNLRLPVGKMELTALSGNLTSPASWEENGADLRSEPQRITLVAGEPPAPVELVLEGRIGVRGSVHFVKDVVETRQAMVRLLALPEGGEVDLQVLASAEPTSWIQGGAEYSFLDLAPGRYAVGVARSWGSPIAAHEVVDVGADIVRCDIEVPPVDPDDYLVVRVWGSDGEPLAGVRFSFRHESEGSSSSSGTNGLRGEDGAYYLSVPEDARAAYYGEARAEDEFSLIVQHEEYGTRTLELTCGQTSAELTFAMPARLEVTVAGYAGSDYLGRMNVVASLTGDGGRDRFDFDRTPIGADGVKRFDALEPGRYTLNLTIHPVDSRWSLTTIATTELDLRAGDNVAQMAVPPLYSLDVTVPEASEGTSVRLSRVTDDPSQGRMMGGSASENCDAGGRVLFEELPAGEYKVYARAGQKRGTMTVSVPCSAVVFEPDKR